MKKIRVNIKYGYKSLKPELMLKMVFPVKIYTLNLIFKKYHFIAA